MKRTLPALLFVLSLGIGVALWLVWKNFDPRDTFWGFDRDIFYLESGKLQAPAKPWHWIQHSGQKNLGPRHFLPIHSCIAQPAYLGSQAWKLTLSHRPGNQQFILPKRISEQSATSLTTSLADLQHGSVRQYNLFQERELWSTAQDHPYPIGIDRPISWLGPVSNQAPFLIDSASSSVSLPSSWGFGGLTALPWGQLLVQESYPAQPFNPIGSNRPDLQTIKPYAQLPKDITRFPRLPLSQSAMLQSGWSILIASNAIEANAKEAFSAKLSALGRLAHSQMLVEFDANSALIIYSIDQDSPGYLYRFITENIYLPGQGKANQNLLTAGTLSVAKISGNQITWLALDQPDEGSMMSGITSSASTDLSNNRANPSFQQQSSEALSADHARIDPRLAALNLQATRLASVAGMFQVDGKVHLLINPETRTDDPEHALPKQVHSQANSQVSSQGKFNQLLIQFSINQADLQNFEVIWKAEQDAFRQADNYQAWAQQEINATDWTQAWDSSIQLASSRTGQVILVHPEKNLAWSFDAHQPAPWIPRPLELPDTVEKLRIGCGAPGKNMWFFPAEIRQENLSRSTQILAINLP